MKTGLFLILICVAVGIFHLKFNEQSTTDSNPTKIKKTSLTRIKASLNDNKLDANPKKHYQISKPLVRLHNYWQT